MTLTEKLGNAAVTEFENLCSYSVNSTILVEYSNLFNKSEIEEIEDTLEDLLYVKFKNEIYGQEHVKLIEIKIQDMYRFIKDLENFSKIY